MKLKRILSAVLALSLLWGMLGSFAAAANGDPWYQQDYWETDQLLSLGAELPFYNAETQQYEIATPEQLLFLSGLWKADDTNGDGVPDAPCQGNYVLTADLDMAPLMAKIGAQISRDSGEDWDGYMPPIAAETSEKGIDATDTKCAFFGVFDGQGYSIQNLRIERRGGKYAGLFGNIGHDYGEGYVRNLALLDILVCSKASCGLLTSAIYGDVDNCVVTGTLICEQKTAGGLAGKIKKNDNGYIGIARNCFVYANIIVLGQGSENGACGGVTSAQSDGGVIENCYVGGSIQVQGTKAESVAGISGNLNGGQILTGSVMAMSDISVESGTGVGLLTGNYSGANGAGISNNYVWEGTMMTGNVSSEHPDEAAYADVDAATLLSKDFYINTVGWDFEKDWNWVGENERGIPLPQPFDEIGLPLVERLAEDLVVILPVLRAREPMTNAGYAGESILLEATLLLPESLAGEAANVTLHYGMDKDGSTFTKSAPMAEQDGVYSVVFPESTEGDWYYYFSAKVQGQQLSFPSNPGLALRLSVLSISAKKTAKYITVNPGVRPDSVGIGWITDAGGLLAKLQYRPAESSGDWTEIVVSDIQDMDLGARGRVTGYSADITGLAPATTYEYQAVTMDTDGEYLSELAQFTTLPAGNEFGFIVISDLQTTVEDGYLPYLYSLDGYLTDPMDSYDFTVMLGDFTEDNSAAQWRNMFKVLSEHYASSLTAFVAGNHENTGDPLYQMFKAVTNLPGGIDDATIGRTTGSFSVGDVCFVVLNTEPLSGIEGTDVQADKQAYYEAQKAWAKEAFEASGCRWRIIASHAGLIQEDPWATAFLEEMCDELDVDLYFNGHIHNYYRATVYQGAAAEVGEGTTFITTSPMGCKFDDFMPGEIDDLLQFQTGGSSDERQYFTHVAASDAGLVVTAYQRTNSGDITNPKQFLEYDEIDTISLTESLSVKRGHYIPASSGEEGSTELAADTPSAVAAFPWWWIVVAAVVIVAAIIVLLVILRKRAKKDQEA